VRSRDRQRHVGLRPLAGCRHRAPGQCRWSACSRDHYTIARADADASKHFLDARICTTDHEKGETIGALSIDVIAPVFLTGLLAVTVWKHAMWTACRQETRVGAIARGGHVDPS